MLSYFIFTVALMTLLVILCVVLLFATCDDPAVCGLSITAVVATYAFWLFFGFAVGNVHFDVTVKAAQETVDADRK